MKKIISVLLMSALTIGCFSGCGKKITEQSTFGNTPVIDETTITTTIETTIETQYEYIEVFGESNKYINLILSNFIIKDDHVTDMYNKVVTTLQNEDITWQVYGSSNQYIALNFNVTGEHTLPIIEKLEYSGYIVDMTNPDDPIISDYSVDTRTSENNKYAIGTVYINCFTEDDANKLYESLCEQINNMFDGESENIDNEKSKTYTLYSKANSEKWLAIVELEKPTETCNYYRLKISAYRSF